MEPEWTRKIPSTTVCDFFYALYVIFMAFFVITIVIAVISFLNMKKLGLAGVLLAIQALVLMALAATKALFNYLICDRALIKKEGFNKWFRALGGCGQL